jgi:hypothetical protein
VLPNSYSVILASFNSYHHDSSMSIQEQGTRTTIYLAAPATRVLDRIKMEYRDRYGIALSVSAVLARLLLGETVDEVVERPFRVDLARIAGERDTLQNELSHAQAKRRIGDLHRIHREVAELYAPVKRISNTLGRGKRRCDSPDLTEAARIEESLDRLMTACGAAIVQGRR